QTYRALVQRDGHSIVVKQSTPAKAVVEVRDRVTHEPMQATWDLDRARRAKITGFTHPDGPWQRQPQNMLLARATAEAARWVASDALLGLYVAEELQDTTQTAEPPPAPVGAQVPQRQRAVRRRTNPPPAISHNGPLPPPPAKGTDDTAAPRGRAENTAAGPEPAVQEPDGQPAEHPPGETSAGNPPPGPAAITDAQRRKMYAILKKIGLGDKDAALDKISEWIGRAVLSTSELTEQEASIVIATISVIEQDQARDGDDD
ncbi:MAG: hypothetical protein J2P28_26935, partial [Actinobacteria bacterium]|nr:hypothetical protein [Actinomycetota bacterium]